jgi:hypothetical protein
LKGPIQIHELLPETEIIKQSIKGEGSKLLTSKVPMKNLVEAKYFRSPGGPYSLTPTFPASLRLRIIPGRPPTHWKRGDIGIGERRQMYDGPPVCSGDKLDKKMCSIFDSLILCSLQNLWAPSAQLNIAL